MLVESYTPRTWRTHSLHICPPEPFYPQNSLNEFVLDWMFLIASLNFSFWSEKAGQPDCYGVEWRSGWATDDRMVHTGYWSLVAALNRGIFSPLPVIDLLYPLALDEDIPITNPIFYSSEVLCPDSLIEYVFRRAQNSTESIPLLRERMDIMRENGHILCQVCFLCFLRLFVLSTMRCLWQSYGGSFNGLLNEFYRKYEFQGTALDLVEMVTDVFPSFRDEVNYEGRTGKFFLLLTSSTAFVFFFFLKNSCISLRLETGSNTRRRNLGCLLPVITRPSTPDLPRNRRS